MMTFESRRSGNELLMNKQARERYINGKQDAMAADQRVKALTSDPKQQEAIYEQASKVFNEVHAKVKGDPKALAKWGLGKTGFPLIDAAMAQLRREGAIHTVLKHALISFLTCGQMWHSWVEGLKVTSVIFSLRSSDFHVIFAHFGH